jgi:hypothetical protein
MTLQNPTPENKAKLEEAHRALQNVVAKARGFESTPGGFAPLKVEPVHTQEHVQHEDELNLLDLEPLPNDHPLVRAAKEQALAALEVRYFWFIIKAVINVVVGYS